MKILDTPKLTYLRDERYNRYIQKDIYGTFTNEIGQRIQVDYSHDYEEIQPPPIFEGNQYSASFLYGQKYLMLTKLGGKFDGFRHRFQIDNYGLSIPVSFRTTDERVEYASKSWHIRSGQFLTYVEHHPHAKWTFTVDKIVTLKIENNTDWITVKAQ